MLKFYLELGAHAKTALVRDNTLIVYEEFDYTNDILDKLYNRLHSYNVDSFIVITNGILSTDSFSNAYKVFEMPSNGKTYSCYVSKTDIDRIAFLAKTLSIKDLRFVDKIGYYLTIKSDKTIFIDSVGGAYSCIAIGSDILSVSYNRYSLLESCLLHTATKFNTKNFVNVSSTSCQQLLKVYDNVENLDETILTTLSVFAYTNLSISNVFELKIDDLNIDYSVPTIDSNNPLKQEFSEEDFTLPVKEEKNDEEEISEEQLPVIEERKPRNKKKKDDVKKKSKQKQNKDRKGGFGIFSIFLIIAAIVIFSGTHLIKVKLSTDNLEMESKISQIDTQINNMNITMENYNLILDNFNTRDYKEYYFIINGIKTKGTLAIIDFNADSIRLTYYSNKESDYEKISKALEKKLTIINASKNGKVESNGKSLNSFSFDVAY